MQKEAEFRQHAEECRSLAEKTRDPGHRAMLLRMADSWERLASDRARMREPTGQHGYARSETITE